VTVSIVSTTASESYWAALPGQAVDDNPGTSWLTNGSALPQWWSATLSAAVPVVAYSITSSDEILRTISEWLFQGSNDSGSTWDTLDSQSGFTWTTGQTRIFSFSNSTSYLQYRIYITANGGDAYASIEEIRMVDVLPFPEQLTVITCTASSDAGGVWVPSNLIDGNGASNWSANADVPGWVKAELSSAQIATAYHICARTDAPASAPNTWTFEGSNDDSTWDTLDTRSGEAFSAGQHLVYSFANTTAYLYYRLSITATNGSPWPSFSEWMIDGSVGGGTDFTGLCPLSGSGLLSLDAVVDVAGVGTLSGSGTLVALNVDGLGSVSVSAAVAVATVLVNNNLGVVGMSAAVAIGAIVELPPSPFGTLANPYLMAETDSCAVDFVGALYLASDPVAMSGPMYAPSIWYEFTESQLASWVASTSGFAHGADIELYTGPPGAGPDDLTFIGTDGSAPTDLGAVTITGLPTFIVTPVRTELVDVGIVALDASVVAAVAI
jgi:hypothetical protein